MRLSKELSQSENGKLLIRRYTPDDKLIALAGNPNVGKSTVFNCLTGMKQHTGNWPGKTVANAQGRFIYNDINYILVDVPGTYSLMANSQEEEIARDFICFGGTDAIYVVCDATCLERNLNLVLQIIEITDKVIVCINLMDEAKKKHIEVDITRLKSKLGVPVVPMTARSNKGVNELLSTTHFLLEGKIITDAYKVCYSKEIEEAISILQPEIEKITENKINSRWLTVRLLADDTEIIHNACEFMGFYILNYESVNSSLAKAREHLNDNKISKELLKNEIVSSIYKAAEDICNDSVKFNDTKYNQKDRKRDKILTNKITGIPIMILLLLGILWITITGANYPSAVLSKFFFYISDRLVDFAVYINCPEMIYKLLIFGVYRVIAWIISVMLPPMAIFFPLFTILEDLGYLPRVAFNLDKCFKKCRSCGKQALTMCMGFGCNAAGVIGCRIIDSPRERLIATLTNNFVPCNGRFPTLIAIISMFFIPVSAGIMHSFNAALILTLVIMFGIIMTFATSRLLSMTLLKGVPSSFTLELPPYRKPQIVKVIVRSIFDRTIFVLGRAVVISIPAGVVIWFMANISVKDITLLTYCSEFLDPLAKFMGLDGIILMGFILGFPANEIVIPIVIMGYMATGHILELDNLNELKALFVGNGWTWITAISTMLFSLMHWPCSTTLLTIKKETKSVKWTLVSFLLPTICGIAICSLFANVAKIFI